MLVDLLKAIPAAGYSAVAAFFAAIAAFLTMRIHRRNAIESARPELVLQSWSRNGPSRNDTTPDVLSFAHLQNVGRGAAFHVRVEASDIVNNRPVVNLPALSVPLVAVNQVIALQGNVLIFWVNVPGSDDSSRLLAVTITVSCSDSGNRRYQTRYHLTAKHSGPPIHGAVTEVAQNIFLTRRSTMSRSQGNVRFRAFVKNRILDKLTWKTRRSR